MIAALNAATNSVSSDQELPAGGAASCLRIADLLYGGNIDHTKQPGLPGEHERLQAVCQGCVLRSVNWTISGADEQSVVGGLTYGDQNPQPFGATPIRPDKPLDFYFYLPGTRTITLSGTTRGGTKLKPVSVTFVVAKPQTAVRPLHWGTIGVETIGGPQFLGEVSGGALRYNYVPTVPSAENVPAVSFAISQIITFEFTATAPGVPTRHDNWGHMLDNCFYLALTNPAHAGSIVVSPGSAGDMTFQDGPTTGSNLPRLTVR